MLVPSGGLKPPPPGMLMGVLPPSGARHDAEEAANVFA